jgi:hypothetical protein
MSVSIKLLGTPELAAAALAVLVAFSSKVGPSRASKPRPRPLGRLVTMFLFRFKLFI